MFQKMSRTITVPDWLNESFLQRVLQEDECQRRDVRVKCVKVTPAVAAGANYVSVIFRVHCEYGTEDEPELVKDVSVIVKTLMTNQFIGKFFEDFGISQKEYIAYREFLPDIYKVLPKTEVFTAKLLYTPDSHTLVLKDLKDEGFVMADRLKQLDFQHCLVCFKTLAKFHAASVTVVNNNPEFIKTLGKEPLYSRQGGEMYQKTKDITKNMVQIFIKAVKEWEGFEDFEEKSRRVWETEDDDLCNVFEPRKDLLNVMNHGDLWTNNMMFKYDSDGNIVDIRLLDFQMCRYGTPATDLLYFLFTSAREEVRESRLDELLTAYLTTLNSVLEQTDCEERLTREQLDAELKRCQSYVFCIAYNMLTAILGDPDDLINLDEMTEESLLSVENNPFEKCYYGKYYKKVAHQILCYLDKEGFFRPHV